MNKRLILNTNVEADHRHSDNVADSNMYTHPDDDDFDHVMKLWEDGYTAGGEKIKAFQVKGMCKSFMYAHAHLPKSEYITWFKDKFGEPEFIRLAHETGDSGTFPHTHVLVRMKTGTAAIDTRAASLRFMWEEPDGTIVLTGCPHIDAVDLRKNKGQHFINWIPYLYKEDEENLDLQDYHSQLVNEKETKKGESVLEFYDRLRECPDPLHAMMMQKPKGIRECKEMWIEIRKEMSDQRRVERTLSLKANLKPRPWQKELFDWISDPTIIEQDSYWWIVGHHGREGKTDFTRIAEIYLKERVLVLGQVGDLRDFTRMCQNTIQCGAWTGEILIINLTAQWGNCDDLYACLETAKDGLFTNFKYDCGNAHSEHMGNSKVVVLSNQFPRLFSYRGNAMGGYTMNGTSRRFRRIHEIVDIAAPLHHHDLRKIFDKQFKPASKAKVGRDKKTGCEYFKDEDEDKSREKAWLKWVGHKSQAVEEDPNEPEEADWFAIRTSIHNAKKNEIDAQNRARLLSKKVDEPS